MHLTVKGKHLDVGDSLREHVREHLSHATQKYLRDPVEATVIFSKEKNHLFRADISIHVGRGIVLQSHHEAPEPYPAFDTAAKLVAKRLSRYKDRLRDHHRHEPDSVMEAAAYTTFAPEEENEAEGGSGGAVIAEMSVQIPMLAVADAVMRLELGNLPALLFRNPKHGELNMLYRRKDGNIGWVDPAPAVKKPAAASAPTAKKPALKKAVKKVAKKAAKKPARKKAPIKKTKTVKKKKR